MRRVSIYTEYLQLFNKMSTEEGNEAKPLSAEDVATLIDDRLAQQLGGLQQALTAEFSKQITGATGRLKKEVSGDLSAQIQSQLQEISEQLKPREGQESASQDQQTGQGQVDANDLSNMIDEKVRSATEATRAEYQQQLQRQSEEIQKLQKATEESQTREEKARQEAALARIESKFAEKAGESVINPNRFFQYLKEVEGSLEIDLDGQEAYFKTGKSDTFGNPVKVKATEYIPELLKREEYSHWAKPRPGSGSGEQPGNASGQRSKYFGGGSDVSTDDLVQMLKQGKGDELMQDLMVSERS